MKGIQKCDVEDLPNFIDAIKEHSLPTAERQVNAKHETHDSCNPIHCQESDIISKSTSGSLQHL